MFIGLDLFGDDTAPFDTFNIVNNFYRLEINNAVFDELHVEKTTLYSYSNAKQSWFGDTIFLAKFQNNLTAGNVNNSGIPIQTIKIKKKKDTDLAWSDVYSFAYNISSTLYEYFDKLVENGINYTYAIVPIGSGVEGNYVTNTIIPSFESTFILDKNSNYHLIFNMTHEDTTLVSPSQIFETLGGTYPIVSSNGNLNYEKGSLSAMILSDSTINSNKIDTLAEKANRNAIKSFLTNKKPKILKNSAGDYYLIKIVDNPTVSFENGFDGILCSIKFAWVEIGNATSSIDLLANGLI